MNIQYNERKYIAIYLWQINDIEKIWVKNRIYNGAYMFH